MQYPNDGDYKIMMLWAVFFFAFCTVSIFGKKRGGAQRQERPLNDKIAVLTTLIFISGTLFYSFSFSRLGQWQISFPESAESAIYFLGLSLVVVGMALMLVSRWQLRHLNNEEVIFSLNTSELVTNGIYSYMKHPMYAGLALIFLGSLIIYKNIPSLIFFLAILFFLRLKISLEENAGAALS